jgi:hypothetical protein
LQDNGETLAIQFPDHPDVDTNTGAIFIPYVDVDVVRYQDTAPWPASANGFGPSLERLSATAYGNDPINWHASPGAPSPGTESEAPLQLNSLVLSGGVLQISFDAAAGLSYSVQYRNSLTAGTWLTLTNIPAASVSQLIQVGDPISGNNPMRFYRLVTPQQP